jgi:hypothetical protein
MTIHLLTTDPSLVPSQTKTFQEQQVEVTGHVDAEEKIQVRYPDIN